MLKNCFQNSNEIFNKFIMMVFLKHTKTSYTRRKIENSKRNGLRHTIFSPRSKSYYIGEWKNDIKEGRGREVNRYINYYIDNI